MERGVPPPCMAREILNLPVEIIIEILSRLPVKSLIRFRCVSKSWYCLIMDPIFISKHLNQATKKTNLNSKRIMVCSSLSIHKLFSFPLSSLSSYPIKYTAKLYPLQTRSGRVTFLDSYNGLSSILINEELFLWNPSIRETKRLLLPPIHPARSIGTSLFELTVWAFGYDPCSVDYKVVRIVKFPGRGLRTETKVYSLKSDSWRKIKECPYLFYAKANGKFANGSFYWLLDFGEDKVRAYQIISLELSTEKYGMLSFLDDANMPKIHEFGLTVLKGMLCLYFNYVESHFVLWVMKDTGVEKSWTRMITIQYQDVPMPCSPSSLCYYIVPGYLFENGEMLLEAKENESRAALVLYTEKLFGVKAKMEHVLSYVREAHVYEETLVSPYLRNEVWGN